MDRKHTRWAVWAALLHLGLSCIAAPAQDAGPLPGTEALTATGNMSERMLDGFDRFLDRTLLDSVQNRQQFWKRDFASPEAYARSIEANRQDFRRIIGMADTRLPVTELEFEATTKSPSLIAETARYRVFAVR